MTNPFMPVASMAEKDDVVESSNGDSTSGNKLTIYCWDLQPIVADEDCLYLGAEDDVDQTAARHAMLIKPAMQCIELGTELFQYHQVLHEFVASEFRYIHQLYLLQHLFADPIKEHGYLVEPTDHEVLFGALPTLLHLHQSFINSLFKVKKIRTPALFDDATSSLARIKRYVVHLAELKTDGRFETILYNFMESVVPHYGRYCANHGRQKALLAVLTEDLDAVLNAQMAAAGSRDNNGGSRFRFRRATSTHASSVRPAGTSNGSHKNVLKEFLEYTRINQSALLHNLECADYLYAIYQRPFRYPLLIGQLLKYLERCETLLAAVEPTAPSSSCLLDTPTCAANPFQHIENPFRPAEAERQPLALSDLEPDLRLELQRVFAKKIKYLRMARTLMDTELQQVSQQTPLVQS